MLDTKALGEVTVLTTEGEETTLAGLWSERPVVLALVRHFG